VEHGGSDHHAERCNLGDGQVDENDAALEHLHAEQDMGRQHDEADDQRHQHDRQRVDHLPLAFRSA
jgi:hypothetical protein